MANTADIVVLFVLVEGPSTVLNRVLQANKERLGMWQIWLADPATLPCDTADGCGTATPVESGWRSSFLGKTPQECGEWLMEWAGKTCKVITRDGDSVKVSRGHFLVLDEGLRYGGWLSVCTMFDEDDVEQQQRQLAEQWIEQETDDSDIGIDDLSTEQQQEVEEWVDANLEVGVGVNCRAIGVHRAALFIMTAYSDQWRNFYCDYDGTAGSEASRDAHWYARALSDTIHAEQTSRSNTTSLGDLRLE